MKIKKTLFSAVVQLPKEYSNKEVTIDVALDKDEEHLTYDEVEDAINKEIELQYNVPDPSLDIDELEDDDYPQILDIVINADDGESYPVISESMDDSELKKDKTFTKYLMLPDAVYTLTPECELWMELKQNGIIGKNVPFEFEKYHKMIEKTTNKIQQKED